LRKTQRVEMHARAASHYEFHEEFLKAALQYQWAGKDNLAAQISVDNTWLIINQGEARTLCRLLENIERGSLTDELLARISWSLGQVYGFLGSREQALACLLELFDRLKETEKTTSQKKFIARICLVIAELYVFEAPQEALQWLFKGLDQLDGEDPLLESELQIKSGAVYVHLADLNSAQEALEKGLALMPEGDSQLRSTALWFLSGVHFSKGDARYAEECAEQALSISRKSQNHFQSAQILNDLGPYRFTLGKWDEAIEDFNQTLSWAKELGNKQLEVIAEVNLGVAYGCRGFQSEAFEHLNNSLALAKEKDLHVIAAIAQFHLADLHIRLGEYDHVEGLLRDAERLAEATEAKGVLVEIWSSWAELKIAQGLLGEASAYALRSLELAEELGEKLELGISLRILGQVHMAHKQHTPAVQALEKSLKNLSLRDPYEAARTKVQLGIALTDNVQDQRRKRLLQEAWEVFDRLGALRDLEITAPLLEL
jgi:tetratricopeptide (TPR) repeat protein